MISISRDMPKHFTTTENMKRQKKLSPHFGFWSERAKWLLLLIEKTLDSVVSLNDYEDDDADEDNDIGFGFGIEDAAERKRFIYDRERGMHAIHRTMNGNRNYYLESDKTIWNNGLHSLSATEHTATYVARGIRMWCTIMMFSAHIFEEEKKKKMIIIMIAVGEGLVHKLPMLKLRCILLNNTWVSFAAASEKQSEIEKNSKLL